MHKNRLLFVGLLVLLALDLSSKYLATQSLRFHLSYEERQRQSLAKRVDESAVSVRPVKAPDWISVLGRGGRYLRLRLYFNNRGMLSQGPAQSPQRLFRMLLWNLGLIGLFLLFIRRQEGMLAFSWLLILAGSLGNFIDRLFVKSLTDRSWEFSLVGKAGYASGVTDFLDFAWYGNAFQGWPVLQNFSWERWPVFNLADAYLFLGALLSLVFMLRKVSGVRVE